VPNRNVWPRNKEKNRKKGKEAAEVATTATATATYILLLFFFGPILNSSRAGAANLPCVVLLSVAFIKCETAFY